MTTWTNCINALPMGKAASEVRKIEKIKIPACSNINEKQRL